MAEDERSGLLRVGTILIAVATGLRVLVVLALLVFVLLLAPRAGTFETSLLVLVASIGVVGALFGYLAWKKLQEGQMRGGTVMASFAAFVPPIDWLFVIGSILVLQSEEGKAERAGGAGGEATDQPAS